MLPEDAPSEWFDLAERDGLEAAGSLKAERKAANPAEEVQNLKHNFHTKNRNVLYHGSMQFHTQKRKAQNCTDPFRLWIARPRQACYGWGLDDKQCLLSS